MIQPIYSHAFTQGKHIYFIYIILYIYLYRDLGMITHRNFICTHSKLETIQMSISRERDKQIMVQSHKGILLGSEKGETYFRL